MKSTFFAIPFLVLSTTAVGAETVFELIFPYATKWTHPVYGGLGNGTGEFDQDGKVNDAVRGATFGSPESEEYRTPMNFTEKGPVFSMRAMAAGINAPEGSEPPYVGSHGVTRQSFRMEARREKTPLYPRMGYAGWLLFSSESFNLDRVDGGHDLTLEAACGNEGEFSWHAMVKANGVFYVSEIVSKGEALKIPSVSKAVWIEYKQAEKGRSMRLIPQNGEKREGKVLGRLEGVGIYVEKAEYNGEANENPRLELTQLRLIKN